MNRIVQEVNENCELHQALINTGYAIYRKNYYLDGKYTGRVVDYYAPVFDRNEVIPGCVRDWATEPR